ncbi:MAG: YggT family protein [Burkholderiales bacterium]|jgi:YggT family protein|nr:YggT family protein [Burkholderiales bacterium]
MFVEIGQLLVRAVFGILVFVLLLRFWMQTLRAPFRNPVGQFVMALTDWAVLPARRVIPAFRGYDLATLVLALIAKGVMLTLLYALVGRGWPWIGGLFLQTVIDLVRDSLQLLIFVVLVNVVMSWIAPYNPVGALFAALSRPFCNVFRRFIPPIGSIDLSPLFVILLAQVLLIVLDNLPKLLAGAFA